MDAMFVFAFAWLVANGGKVAVHDGAWCVGQLAHQSNGLVRKMPDPGELAFPGDRKSVV